MTFSLPDDQASATTEGSSLSLFPTPINTTYGADYTKSKADKYNLILGQDSPGIDGIVNAVSQGNQAQYDAILKTREDTQNSMQRNDLIRGVAERSGGQPTQEDLSLVQGLSDDELHSADVNTIFEKKYSDSFTNYVSSIPDNTPYQEAADADPNGALDVLDRSAYSQQRTLAAQDVLEKVNKQYEDQGYFATGIGFLKSAIPGYDWYKTQNRVEGAKTTSLLQGHNLEEQIGYLYSLPPEQFKTALSTAVDELSQDNVGLAQQFAQAVMSFTSSDNYLMTGMNVGDLATVADIAGAGVKLGAKALRSPLEKLATGMAGTTKAITRSPRDVADMAADVGLTRQATVSKVVDDTVKGDVSGVTVAQSPKDIETKLPTIYSPQRIFEGQIRLDNQAQNKVRETILRSADLVQDFFNKGQLVDRLEPEQIAKSADEAFDRIKDVFTNVNHSVIDAWPVEKSVVPASADKVTNTATAVMRFGQRDGTPFVSEQSAKQFADKYIGIQTNDFTVVQTGLGGYNIEIRKPLADVGAFRSMELPTTLQAPQSFSTTFLEGMAGKTPLKGLKSADYLLDQGNVMARGRVVHSQEFLADYMKKLTEPFVGKDKTWMKEMDNVFASDRATRKYSDTIPDFENNFARINGRAPDADHVSAYFTYVQLNDLDYLVRDADIVKQQRRLGGEKISMKVVDATNKPTEVAFNGKVIPNLPYDTQTPFRVKVLQQGKEVKNLFSPVLGTAGRKEIQDLLDNGYKVVFNDTDKAYYVMKDFKRDTIPLGQLNRVEGGHNEYRYSHFVKQPDLKTGADKVTDYRGDRSLYVTTTERQAKEISGYFEKARTMVKNGEAGAKKFIDDHLPISYADFIKKVKTGDIDIDAPVVATRKGQRTVDVSDFHKSPELHSPADGRFFNDTVNNEHNLFGDVGGRYTTERQDRPLDVVTSEDGKVVVRNDIEPMLKPLETLQTSTRDMLNVRILNDYKLKSTQDWVQQFGHLVDADYNKVLANPLYYMQRGLFKSGADASQVQVAKNVRNAVTSLYSYRDPTEQAFQNFKEKVLSSVFDVAGEGGRRFVDDKLLVSATDVQSYMRSAAFNMKLGFFNPKQLFLQASQSVNAIAISPKAGISGVRALPILRMALMTEDDNVLRGMAKKFKGLTGWDKDEFLQMVESYKNSGFSTVAHDLAYLDDFKAKTVNDSNKLKQVWNYNTSFFNEGERTARSISYATAFREWKTLNPSKELDRFAESKILQRAKDMTGNITRDSNAAWQKGWSSVATQFFGYQARFMEQLWDGGLLKDGRKLSQVEKARLMTSMSTLYGVPTLVSATTAYPMRDQIKDWMAQEGVPFDSAALGPFIDGLVPSMINAMTGQTADVSSAYGPNGMPQIKDIFDGNANWVDTFSGASGGVIMDTMSQTFPLGKAMADIFNPDVGSTFPVAMNDLLQPLKNISTVKSASDLFEAINTHRYLSRTGAYLTDVSVPESLQQMIFGVSPERVSEAYSQIAAIKGDKDAVNQYKKEVEDNTYQGMVMSGKGDMDSASVYFSRAHSAAIRGGLSLKDQVAARKHAIERSPMTDSVAKNWEDKVLTHRQQTETNRVIDSQPQGN